MTLKTKLFIYFFSLASLILIVGLIFYFQLKSLIEPLTPQSIPHNVERLAHIIERNEVKDKLLYQQLLVEYNLEHYVLTEKTGALQAYYMNDALLTQLLEQAKAVRPSNWVILAEQLKAIRTVWQEIINLMQSHQTNEAKQIFNNEHFQLALKNYHDTLNRYFHRPNRYSNEAAIVTVKLAIKNSNTVLEDSLNSILIIFIDAILVAIIFIIYSVRTLVQPIKLLRNNIEHMNVEKLDTKISPDILQLQGEVGDLARSFDELFNKLRTATVLRDELLAEIQRHKKTERTLEKTAAFLRESNQDLDQFSYAASHDLRSPLRSIERLVSWIEEDCYDILPADARKNFDLIKKRMQRLDALIMGMLEYSRAGRVVDEREGVDINQMLAEIIDTLSPPEHIKIRMDTKMPTLMTYKAKLTQVFLNLISNAIKYNDKEIGYIHIGYEVVDNNYQFYVKDNGCGIESQYQEKIFNIFQTLQSRDTIEGSGIGLAIVKKIVEKQDGKVWLESTPHKGATFYFTWPRSGQ